MKEIHIIFIIFILFLLYNYFFVYEGVDFETAATNSSLEKILTQNNWSNKQTFNEDVSFSNNINVAKQICIGNSCIGEDEIKMLLGKKALYIYKRNNKNSYLYLNNNFFVVGKPDNDDKEKKRYGAFFISNKIPQNNNDCSGYTDDYKKCYDEA